MKTITAKDFQVQHSAILKQVAEGDEYEVTFHRKPLVRLVPIQKRPTNKAQEGSPEAFVQSLLHTVTAKGDLRNLSYKELRSHMVAKKYGER
jgi:prevent-host-death family protein